MVAMLSDTGKPLLANGLASPAPFQPLDSGILNESIPAFYVCRGSDGFWLVRDIKGENGGIFLLKNSALAFARRASHPNGCATILSSEPFELDVENQGNPLVACLRPLMRLLQRIGSVAAGS